MYPAFQRRWRSRWSRRWHGVPPCPPFRYKYMYEVFLRELHRASQSPNDVLYCTWLAWGFPRPLLDVQLHFSVQQQTMFIYELGRAPCPKMLASAELANMHLHIADGHKTRHPHFVLPWCKRWATGGAYNSYLARGRQKAIIRLY